MWLLRILTVCLRSVRSWCRAWSKWCLILLWLSFGWWWRRAPSAGGTAWSSCTRTSALRLRALRCRGCAARTAYAWRSISLCLWIAQLPVLLSEKWWRPICLSMSSFTLVVVYRLIWFRPGSQAGSHPPAMIWTAIKCQRIMSASIGSLHSKGHTI